MEQSLARGCPDKPSSPRAGLQLPEAPKAQYSGGEATGYQRPVKAAGCPVFAPPHLFLSFFSFFSFPPHIPTGIIVSWRVRLGAPPREGSFLRAHLYGEFQKSTAATQAGCPARTRIPHFATSEGCLRRVRGRLLPAWGVPWGRGRARESRSYRVAPTLHRFGHLPYRPPTL